MNLAPIIALSFDLDDTLWPVRPVLKRAEEAMWAYLDAHYPRVRDVADRTTLAEIRRAVMARSPDRVHDLTWLRRAVLAEVARLADYPDELVDGAFGAFDDQRNQVEFYDDALPALERLSARYRLVSLSNGNAQLSRTGLDPYFEAQVTTRDAGAAKPDVRMFRAAEAALGVTAEQVLHVGDDPDKDVQAARLAGQQAVWINRTRDEWPEGHGARPAEVHDLAELVDLLKA